MKYHEIDKICSNKYLEKCKSFENSEDIKSFNNKNYI